MTTEEKTDSQSYAEMVSALCKPGEDILDSLTPEKCHMLHMAIGLAGELMEFLTAPNPGESILELGDLEFYHQELCTIFGVDRITAPAEADPRSEILWTAVEAVVDAVKRIVIYCDVSKREGMADKLQDLSLALDETYLEYGLSLKEVRRINAEKLAKRYAAKVYSNSAAVARADEQ